MIIAYVALILQVIFLLLAFVVRTVLHARRSGSSGFRLGAARGAPAEALGAGLLIVAGFASGAAVILDLLDVLGRVSPLDNLPIRIAGCALAVAGIALIWKAQSDMGESWRIGVDPNERTDLVTGGLFRWTRNPIFLGMLAFWTGMGMMVPNALSLLAAGLALVGVEVQVRLVEEPYLTSTHGEPYRRYAAATGRLLPGIGKLKASGETEVPSHGA